MPGALCTSCGLVAPDGAMTCPACGAWLTAGDDAELPRRLARSLGEHYRIQEEIGRGGYAIVYRVRDLRLERDVAAKVLNPDLAVIAELAERFRREAKTAAKLNHPNIVPIYFVGAEAAPCYVMPLIEGESLAARLRREGRLAMTVVLGIARDIAGALDYAHEAGVVHRDVKPDNIVIDLPTGRSLLMDFGIAKALAVESVLTGSGVIIGTPHYMSPEQAAGESDLDRRSDVYSLGVVTYQMLAGDPPFTGATAHAIFAQHLGVDPPAISAQRPDLRPPVDAVLQRAMAKERTARYGSAGELVTALEQAFGRASLRASSATVIERQTADDIRLFRTVGTAAGSAAGALQAAADVAAMAEAVNAVREVIAGAVDAMDVATLLEHVLALVERADDPRPALRQPVRDALQKLATDERLMEMVAGAWRGGDANAQGHVERILDALLPEGAAALIAVARRAKSAEFMLLADRVGAIDDAVAGDLARNVSPAVAQAFGVALRESTRPRPVVEHWLALLARHAHPGVRTLAVETASAHGGGVSERIARLVLADADAGPRHAAVRAMGTSRRREALPDLSQLLERGSREDQCLAAEAIGTLGVPEAVPVLERVFQRRRLFRPERGAVQRAAARALVTLGPIAAAALATLTTDSDREIRRIAEGAHDPR